MVSTVGKITPEGLDKIRSRIGNYYHGGQAIRVLEKDILRHSALDHGVRNPLFFDDEYGRKTRYGSMVGFPLFLMHVQSQSGTQVGGLPGVQAYHTSDEWEFYHVLRPGDQIGAAYRPAKVVEKTGQYAGLFVFVYAEGLYIDQRGELVGKVLSSSARTERKEAAERGKYIKDTDETRYTQEQLDEIRSLCDHVEIRGAVPRYWEDVKVGDELSPLVKGPMRRSDIAFFGPGPGEQKGLGALTRGAHWYNIEPFIKHPGFAAGDVKSGRRQHPHAGHWEKEMSLSLGLPAAYDLGPQRGCWLMEIILNWIGDDAFLRKFYYELRRFNLEGDTTWVRGKVSSKWLEGSQHLVKFEVRGEDQRGKVTTQGYGEAVLPSRYPGYVVPM